MYTCPACNGTDVQTDPFSQDIMCANPLCYALIEENRVVSEVQFSENKDGTVGACGQKITWEQTNGVSGKGESRELTLQKGNRVLADIANGLNLKSHLVEQGKRIFLLAVQRSFTRGRQTKLVGAACLYIVCRRDRSPHLLVDFSDVLQTSVKQIGQVYMKLVRLLNFDNVVDVPLIDPSLFMERFATKLPLPSNQAVHEVTQTAIRFVQAMNRDWICTGRRPTGLCGAALLLATRYHGHRILASEISNVVRMGENTLKRRLFELRQTPLALMDRKQFELTDFSKPTQECFPPAMLMNARKDQQKALKWDEDIGRALVPVKDGNGLKWLQDRSLPLEDESLPIEDGAPVPLLPLEDGTVDEDSDIELVGRIKAKASSSRSPPKCSDNSDSDVEFVCRTRAKASSSTSPPIGSDSDVELVSRTTPPASSSTSPPKGNDSDVELVSRTKAQASSSTSPPKASGTEAYPSFPQGVSLERTDEQNLDQLAAHLDKTLEVENVAAKKGPVDEDEGLDTMAPLFDRDFDANEPASSSQGPRRNAAESNEPASSSSQGPPSREPSNESIPAMVLESPANSQATGASSSQDPRLRSTNDNQNSSRVINHANAVVPQLVHTGVTPPRRSNTNAAAASCIHGKHNTDLLRDPFISQGVVGNEEEEDEDRPQIAFDTLSDVDSEDLDLNAILTEEEQAAKRDIWNEVNKDYLEEIHLRDKEKKRKKMEGEKTDKKRRINERQKADSIAHASRIVLDSKAKSVLREMPDSVLDQLFS